MQQDQSKKFPQIPPHARRQVADVFDVGDLQIIYSLMLSAIVSKELNTEPGETITEEMYIQLRKTAEKIYRLGGFDPSMSVENEIRKAKEHFKDE